MLLAALLIFASCGNNETPLDADTRAAIDSTVLAQTQIMQRQMDSLCKKQEAEKLPGLIDSIKKVRLQEIEEKLQQKPR